MFNFDLEKLLNEQTNSNASYNKITEVMKKAAGKVIIKVRTKKHYWMTNKRRLLSQIGRSTTRLPMVAKSITYVL